MTERGSLHGSHGPEVSFFSMHDPDEPMASERKSLHTFQRHRSSLEDRFDALITVGLAVTSRRSPRAACEFSLGSLEESAESRRATLVDAYDALGSNDLLSKHGDTVEVALVIGELGVPAESGNSVLNETSSTRQPSSGEIGAQASAELPIKRTSECVTVQSAESSLRKSNVSSSRKTARKSVSFALGGLESRPGPSDVREPQGSSDDTGEQSSTFSMHDLDDPSVQRSSLRIKSQRSSLEDRFDALNTVGLAVESRGSPRVACEFQLGSHETPAGSRRATILDAYDALGFDMLPTSEDGVVEGFFAIAGLDEAPPERRGVDMVDMDGSETLSAQNAAPTEAELVAATGSAHADSTDLDSGLCRDPQAHVDAQTAAAALMKGVGATVLVEEPNSSPMSESVSFVCGRAEGSRSVVVDGEEPEGAPDKSSEQVSTFSMHDVDEPSTSRESLRTFQTQRSSLEDRFDALNTVGLALQSRARPHAACEFQLGCPEEAAESRRATLADSYDALGVSHLPINKRVEKDEEFATGVHHSASSSDSVSISAGSTPRGRQSGSFSMNKGEVSPTSGERQITALEEECDGHVPQTVLAAACCESEASAYPTVPVAGPTPAADQGSTVVGEVVAAALAAEEPDASLCNGSPSSPHTSATSNSASFACGSPEESGAVANDGEEPERAPAESREQVSTFSMHDLDEPAASRQSLRTFRKQRSSLEDRFDALNTVGLALQSLASPRAACEFQLGSLEESAESRRATLVDAYDALGVGDLQTSDHGEDSEEHSTGVYRSPPSSDDGAFNKEHLSDAELPTINAPVLNSDEASHSHTLEEAESTIVAGDIVATAVAEWDEESGFASVRPLARSVSFKESNSSPTIENVDQIGRSPSPPPTPEEGVLSSPISPQQVGSSVRSSVSEYTDDSDVKPMKPPPLSIGQASSNANTADTLGWSIELQYEVLDSFSTPQHTPRATPRCETRSPSQLGSENIELYSMSRPRSPRRRADNAFSTRAPPQAGTAVLEPDTSQLQAEIRDLQARYQQLDRETKLENQALLAELEQERSARDDAETHVIASRLVATTLARSLAEDLQAKCYRLEHECHATRVELEAERYAHLDLRRKVDATDAQSLVSSLVTASLARLVAERHAVESVPHSNSDFVLGISEDSTHRREQLRQDEYDTKYRHAELLAELQAERSAREVLQSSNLGLTVGNKDGTGPPKQLQQSEREASHRHADLVAELEAERSARELLQNGANCAEMRIEASRLVGAALVRSSADEQKSWQVRYQQLERESHFEHQALIAELVAERCTRVAGIAKQAPLVAAHDSAPRAGSTAAQLKEVLAELEAERCVRQAAEARVLALASKVATAEAVSAAPSACAGSGHEALPIERQSAEATELHSSASPDVSVVAPETAPVPAAFIAEGLVVERVGFWHHLFGARSPAEPSGVVDADAIEAGMSEESIGPFHAEEDSVEEDLQPAASAGLAFSYAAEGFSGLFLCSRSLMPRPRARGHEVGAGRS